MFSYLFVSQIKPTSSQLRKLALACLTGDSQKGSEAVDDSSKPRWVQLRGILINVCSICVFMPDRVNFVSVLDRGSPVSVVTFDELVRNSFKLG